MNRLCLPSLEREPTWRENKTIFFFFTLQAAEIILTTLYVSVDRLAARFFPPLLSIYFGLPWSLFTVLGTYAAQSEMSYGCK